MSKTWELGCTTCKAWLWIGQGSIGSTFYVYTADEHKLRLQAFLSEHVEHPLQMVETERRPDDWPENEFDERPDDSPDDNPAKA
jgi:hypothetical protein